ncbi:Guanylate cyclase [Aphelenchoides besseyi]|nr:Guanylate cyclase [Aphelenchoides besseyi]
MSSINVEIVILLCAAFQVVYSQTLYPSTGTYSTNLPLDGLQTTTPLTTTTPFFSNQPTTNITNGTITQSSASTINSNPFGGMLSTLVSQFTTTTSYPITMGKTLSPLTIDGHLQIRVGLLFANNSKFVRSLIGFGQSAPAITLALQKIASTGLTPNVNYTFYWYMDNCDQSMSAGYVNRLINVDQVNVILGPACPSSATVAASIASYNNVPLILWGPPFPSELSSPQRFPTVMSVTVNTNSIGMGIQSMMEQYEWTDFALIYSFDRTTRMCDFVQQGVEDVFENGNSRIYVSFKRSVGNTTAEFMKVLSVVKQVARIVVVCLDNNNDMRNFLLSAYDSEMYTDDFVFIFLTLNSQGTLIKQNLTYTYTEYWKEIGNITDGRDNDALAIAQRSLIFGFGSTSKQTIEQFEQQMEAQFNKYPFFCDLECMGGYNETSTYSRSLYDAMFLFSLALNQTRKTGNMNDLLNGTLIANSMVRQFQGMTGEVVTAQNGTRAPVFQITGLSPNNTPTVFALITVMSTSNVSFNALYGDEATGMWAIRGGQRPLGRPLCGYNGKECPLSTGSIIGIVAGGLAILLVIALLMAAYFIRYVQLEQSDQHERMKYQDLYKLEWEIPYLSLTRVETEREQVKSMRSVQSTTSGGSKTEFESFCETENHSFFMYKRNVVYANKHVTRVKLKKSDITLLRQLRNFDHDNANRFLGLVLDGPDIMYSVWKYCQRGSLQDVLLKESYVRDQMVMFALMRDIANGLLAIHNSYIEIHGALSSDCCLINDRWQVKIGNFGLGIIREKQELKRKDLLWTAPELIRTDNRHGTQAGDVYSFAIICSELLNRECAWDGANSEEEVDVEYRRVLFITEIIYRLKRGGANPYRPSIHPPDDISQNIINLVNDCWAENPDHRPTMENIRGLLKQLLKNGKQNLMDYVFSMLEQYASSLENEVEQRTRELREEQKKSDILLYRLLPQQVADRLKMGQSVEPESFDLVTVLFSDVVSFTTLAALCSPLQVVQLLNDLCTNFDTIIDQWDAYKIETIGDGYLISSGLPRRNGNKHVTEIANLAMDFLKSLMTFRINHLPQHRINIRIGFHTGPVVAGVVGTTMPRYCLFGDTVNTASRMESNSKPGKIHISSSANHYLMEEAKSGFVTESRGEILIKGKGLMETFWLLGKGTSIDYITEPLPDTPSSSDMPMISDADQVSPHIIGEIGIPQSKSRSPSGVKQNGIYTGYKNGLQEIHAL